MRFLTCRGAVRMRRRARRSPSPTRLRAAVAQVDALPDGPVRLIRHSIGDGCCRRWQRLGPSASPRVVFVAAAVLNRGESGIGVTPVERRAGYYELAAASPDNSLMITFEAAWGGSFSIWVRRRRSGLRASNSAPFNRISTRDRWVGDIETPRRYVAFDDDRTYPDGSTITFAAGGCLRGWCRAITAPCSALMSLWRPSPDVSVRLSQRGRVSAPSLGWANLAEHKRSAAIASALRRFGRAGV